MDHEMAVKEKMTERYLLKELDQAERAAFEEHFFGCRDCAYDVRAGAAFIGRSKEILKQSDAPSAAKVPRTSSAGTGWGWLRPAFAVPVLAALLVVVGYQNFVQMPKLRAGVNSPQVLPWASVTVGTMGGEKQEIADPEGKGFLLFVRIPASDTYVRYTADLYNPDGKLDFSLAIPAASGQDEWPVLIPEATREAGSYRMSVQGVTASGESKALGTTSFELQTGLQPQK